MPQSSTLPVLRYALGWMHGWVFAIAKAEKYEGVNWGSMALGWKQRVAGITLSKILAKCKLGSPFSNPGSRPSLWGVCAECLHGNTTAVRRSYILCEFPVANQGDCSGL